MNYVIIGFELAVGVALACLAVWLVVALVATTLAKISAYREAAAEAERLQRDRWLRQHPDWARQQ
jgi:hypothetical protein